MRKSGVWILFWLLVNVGGHAQDVEIQKYGNSITAASLENNLSILASDAMEGRETGKRGQKMAAAFIKAHFEKIGLKGPVNGDYYQSIDLYTTRPGESYVKIGQERFNNFSDITYYGNSDSGGEVSLPLVFAGNGSAAALEQVDIQGKAILLVTDAEFPTNETLSLLRQKGAKMIFVSHSKSKGEFTIVSNQIKSFSGRRDLSLKRPPDNTTLPGVFVVSPVMSQKYFGFSREQLSKILGDG